MKALEMLRARKNSSVTTVTAEKTAVVTAQPLITEAVTSVTVVTNDCYKGESKICNDCFFLRLHELNPYTEHGYCKKGHSLPLISQSYCASYQRLEPF